MEKYMNVAVLAAKKAGAIHKKYFNKGVKATKKDKSFNLLTVADLEAEKEIVSIIRKNFPGHNFLAEENKYEKSDSEYTWIIDPLDGTNNFSSNIPIFCVSIALAKNDEVILGVIYDVTHNDLFSARKGGGAFLNGKKISVSSAEELNQSVLITGFYYDRGTEMRETLEKIQKFFSHNILGIRRFGSAALDLCFVACGRAAGFWEFELNVWDFAAGKLIIEEAGGKVTGRKGEAVPLKKSFVVASNSKIHDKMLAVIR